MEKQIYSENFTVGKNGNLHIDGVDMMDIVKQYGTAVYVMSDACLRKICRTYVNAMRRNFGEKFKVSYASKALCAGFMYNILKDEEMDADVVSGGELYTALKAGFPAKNLHFHGNNKTDAEIDYAASSGIGLVVIDNYEEISRLDAAAKRHNTKIRTAIRVKPGVDAHTHAFVQTGQNDSKFGFGLNDGMAMKAAKAIYDCENLIFYGVHCHIGSQIFETEPFGVAADIMLKLIKEMNETIGCKISQFILGGGFGIKYMPTDKPVDTDKMIDFIGNRIKATAKSLGLDLPEIVIEPGRSVAGPAGVTLYTVGGVKDIPDARTYVSVDGGLPDNPRFALYQSEYDAAIVTRPDAPRTKKQTIAGKCCESGDLVARDLMFAPAVPGDTLCVFATGAYNYSMASNYNRIPRLPIILVKDGKTQVVVKRETYEDLVRNDIF